MKKIAHIITGLGVGGAETFLLRLIPELEKSGFQSVVIYLTGTGDYVDAYTKKGISVISLGINSPVQAVTGFWRLRAILRKEAPDIVQAWMYHANFLGGLAAKMLKVPSMFAVLQSNLSPKVNKKLTTVMIRIGAKLSKLNSGAVLYDSDAARAAHEAVGFDSTKSIVIPNGVDPEKFMPDHVLRDEIRAELGITPDAIVIGHVARYDVQKDHRSFLQAVNQIRTRNASLNVIMVGDGVDWQNSDLTSDIDRDEASQWLHLLGPRSDVARLYNGMDIFCSSSIGESCPNVVLEAMIMGLPCVATDVGDVGQMVGDNGLVVPPSSVEELAIALTDVIDSDADKRRSIGASLRQRALQEYTLGRAASRFAEVYEQRLTLG
jgi:glycosyltransferase involved in cell wall biosynthesis